MSLWQPAVKPTHRIKVQAGWAGQLRPTQSVVPARIVLATIARVRHHSINTFRLHLEFKSILKNITRMVTIIHEKLIANKNNYSRIHLIWLILHPLDKLNESYCR